MAQILFVAPDLQAVAGLRHATSQQRAHWAVGWAEHGAAALELLAGRQVDVLVTDVSTPGLDGAGLLEQARQRFPSTARVVLSGHANRDALISTAGGAQQFVAKPCDPATLIATVDSLLNARSLVQDVQLRSVLGGPEALPKPPAIYLELAALADRPDSTVAEIAAVIERDLATTAELLQLVNCSFFGLANEISSVTRAVTLLGLDVIQALVLAGKAFRPVHPLPPGLVAADIAAQGLRACVALRNTEAAGGMAEPQIRQLSVGALLRDVGLLSLAANRPDAWAEYTAARASLPAREAEVRAFGCTVGRASAYLLALWGFHSVTVNALAGQPVALEDEVARADVPTSVLAIAQAYEFAARKAAPTGSGS